MMQGTVTWIRPCNRSIGGDRGTGWGKNLADSWLVRLETILLLPLYSTCIDTE